MYKGKIMVNFKYDNLIKKNTFRYVPRCISTGETTATRMEMKKDQPV